MVFLFSRPIIYGGVGAEFRLGAVKKLLEMGVEFGLIFLDSQHIVGLLFDALLGRAGTQGSG